MKMLLKLGEKKCMCVLSFEEEKFFYVFVDDVILKDL